MNMTLHSTKITIIGDYHTRSAIQKTDLEIILEDVDIEEIIEQIGKDKIIKHFDLKVEE